MTLCNFCCLSKWDNQAAYARPLALLTLSCLGLSEKWIQLIYLSLVAEPDQQSGPFTWFVCSSCSVIVHYFPLVRGPNSTSTQKRFTVRLWRCHCALLFQWCWVPFASWAPPRPSSVTRLCCQKRLCRPSLTQTCSLTSPARRRSNVTDQKPAPPTDVATQPCLHVFQTLQTSLTNQ